MSVKWEVVSETEVQNNRKIKEEPFMQGEMHNDIKQDIGTDFIFSEKSILIITILNKLLLSIILFVKIP